jgi:Tfp pilus assembly PilM family ATPase
MRSTIDNTRSERIAKDVDAWLAAGNEITVLEINETNQSERLAREAEYRERARQQSQRANRARYIGEKT